mmetsp:Transcript_10684/g.15883  ORF Transcript_10684/g.15883 Transcript_10684/m.15883 type:complete len:80 (+) Transcript_10684:470-709(+)
MSRAPCLLRYLSVLPVVHEKPEEGLIHPPGRAHNRIRSPRLAASGLWNELGEGSRQIGSGTLGKGLALRGGCGDPCVDA